MMMSQQKLSQQAEELYQLPKEKLVEIIMAQQSQINQLQQEIDRLKTSLHLDSQTSSKPPSTDLLKKSEKQKSVAEPQSPSKESPKKKPGGQPLPQGKTRKGFGRIDRYEISHPETCHHCGNQQLNSEAVKVETYQVAQLVERPIEIVEYQRHHCHCSHCGSVTQGEGRKYFSPRSRLGVQTTRIPFLVGKLRTSLLSKATRTIMGIR